ncbi:MAG: hypothetical protein RLZZ390_1225 [Bacteroidota bacterium]|jgi:FlaA1/EpsC-like NDP-sugar epimerase
MESLLLATKYKKIGWLLFLPSFFVGLIYMIVSDFPFNPRIMTFGYFGTGLSPQTKTQFRFEEIELIPNLTSILVLIGGLLIMFSKEKKEDEFINQIRLSSLQFAVFLNYILLLLCILFIHGFPFFHVLVYNLFTIILIYILRFQFLIYKTSIRE